MVLAVAGNIDHDHVVALAREYFAGRLVDGREPRPPRNGSGRLTGRPGMTLIKRDSEQTHLTLGVRVPGRNWSRASNSSRLAGSKRARAR